MTNFCGEDVVTSPMSLCNVMYFCIMAGLGANRAVTYFKVYETTSEMHGVNIRV